MPGRLSGTMCAGPRTTDRPPPDHAVAAMLDRLELEPDRRMATLSGGESRRAELARVLAVAPDILLLDEPTNHLDLPAIEWLERLLRGYEGAVVVVSHLTAVSSPASPTASCGWSAAG